MSREPQAFAAGLLVMLCVSVAAQNPTMNEHRPAPVAPKPSVRPATGDLQRDYDQTVPGLVDSVDRIESTAVAVSEQQIEMRVELALVRQELNTLGSYFAWMAAAMTAVAIGIGLHFVQAVSAKRKARGEA